jgi:hypothetical protein
MTTPLPGLPQHEAITKPGIMHALLMQHTCPPSCGPRSLHQVGGQAQPCSPPSITEGGVFVHAIMMDSDTSGGLHHVVHVEAPEMMRCSGLKLVKSCRHSQGTANMLCVAQPGERYNPPWEGTFGCEQSAPSKPPPIEGPGFQRPAPVYMRSPPFITAVTVWIPRAWRRGVFAWHRGVQK